MRPFLSSHYKEICLGLGSGSVIYFCHNRYTAAFRLKHFYSGKVESSQTSLRKDDVTKIQQRLSEHSPSAEIFVVVHGPQGVGKTTAVQTALSGASGVVLMDVWSGLKENEICDLVHLEIWPDIFQIIRSRNRRYQARLTIKWFTYWYGKPPCVVLTAVTRTQPEELPTNVLAAAEMLSKQGLQVIIDASQDYVASARRFTRASLVYLDYMDWESVQKIPQLHRLMGNLESLHLTHKVQAVIGDCPRQLELLQSEIPTDASPAQIKEITINFLDNQLQDAVFLQNTFIKNVPTAEKILKALKQNHLYAPQRGEDIPENKVIRRANSGYVLRTPAVKVVVENNLDLAKTHWFLEQM
jgi:hypothetical protein